MGVASAAAGGALVAGAGVGVAAAVAALEGVATAPAVAGTAVVEVATGAGAPQDASANTAAARTPSGRAPPTSEIVRRERADDQGPIGTSVTRRQPLQPVPVRGAPALAFIAALIVSSCGPSGPSGGACPPPGPWPQPPGCPGGPSIGPGAASAAPGTGAVGPGAATISFTALVQPRYPGPRGATVFPPSCDMLPSGMFGAKVARVQCEDFKKGAMVFWKEEACVAMPFEAGNQACREERDVLRKLGAENAAKMRAADPDWWRTPYLNTYVYGDVRLRTEELQPTARIWAGGTYWGWRDDEIYMTQAAGIRVIPSASLVKGPSLDALRDALLKEEGVTVKSPQDMQKPEYVRVKTDLKYLLSHSTIYRTIAVAEAKDLDGKTLMTDRCDAPLAPPRAKCTSEYTIYMDPTVAAFREHLIAWYKAQVDAGADGIHIDDASELHADRGFNEDTMRRFREWLSARPAALARAGIADASSFDYRAFLVRQGYTSASLAADLALPNEGWRRIPLMVEFRTFYSAERERALTEIVSAVRAHAAAKGRTDLVITGNAGELTPRSAFLVPLFDMFSFEHDYLGPRKDPMGYTSLVPVAELANAKERPVTAEQVMGPPAEAQIMATKLQEPLRSDLIRLQIMEGSAVHGGSHYIRQMQLPAMTETTDADSVYLAMEDRTGLAEVKKAFGFIQKYRETYRAVAQSPAKVALVYDNDEVAREWREELKEDHQGAVLEAARALWAKNVEFDIVNWKQLAARPYSVVVLAPSKSIAADRAAQVVALRAKGVKVYALWQLPAGVSVDGKVSGDDVARIGAQASPPLALPDGMRSLQYVDGKGATIIHLMNYDYGADGFRAKKNVPIDPAFLAGATSVTYASLERPDPVTLDPKDPRIPEIRTYGLVIAKR